MSEGVFRSHRYLRNTAGEWCTYKTLHVSSILFHLLMMIETEQGIPLTHTATLHTEIKDLSSYDQHKHYEVLRRSTYNTSTFNTSHP